MHDVGWTREGRRWLLGAALGLGCGDDGGSAGTEAASSDSGSASATTASASGMSSSTLPSSSGPDPDSTSTASADTTEASTGSTGTAETFGSTGSTGSTGTTSDESTGGSTGVLPGCAPNCPTHELDVVFVVDNSASMAQEQRKLALSLPLFMAQIESLQVAEGVIVDLNLMFTTSDFGNPLCTPFQPVGYDPSQGSPVSTACTTRLDDFEGLVPGISFPEACTDVCAAEVVPSDAWIHVSGTDDNVVGGTPLQAMQCLLPQGNVGCGYEAPLETMLQALDPGAAWNAGGAAFLRDGADLAIVMLTDEMDCSVLDYSIMQDTTLMNVNPNTGSPQASSAICWNAGVECDGPDGGGLYSNCTPAVGLGLQPTTRYTNYLVDELVGVQGKDVMMLALTGIPSVTEHAIAPPYEPTAGGVADLEFHTWQDGEYPVGDIAPDEFANGITAADKEFANGIGPGCTGNDGAGGWSQGLPPSRIRTVCEALDAQGAPHCCMESVCDDDYAGAMSCLRGMIEIGLP